MQGEKLDLLGGSLQITYADTVASSTNVVLTEEYIDMDSVDMNKLGEQDIKVCFGGNTLTFQIQVEPVRVEEIKCEKSYTVNKGNSVQIEASVMPSNASYPKFVYKSADESIAVVDENGTVTGASVGTAQIYVIAA